MGLTFPLGKRCLWTFCPDIAHEASVEAGVTFQGSLLSVTLL